MLLCNTQSGWNHIFDSDLVTRIKSPPTEGGSRGEGGGGVDWERRREKRREGGVNGRPPSVVDGKLATQKEKEKISGKKSTEMTLLDYLK